MPLKKRKIKCNTPYCRNKHIHNGLYCYSCYDRTKRKNDPIKYAYANLKFNAKRRGKLFTLSLEYVRELCLASGYVEVNSYTKAQKDKLSFERIDNDKGYEVGNVRVITVSENSRIKYLSYLQKVERIEGDIIIGNPDDCEF